MFLFRIKERIANVSFKTGRKVTLDEVAAGTGIHRAPLSKIGTKKGYNSSTDEVDRLCTFFHVGLKSWSNMCLKNPQPINIDESIRCAGSSISG